MEKNPTIMHVVAGALGRADGRWLMHRRPADKHHGGLWEFPGGKVEDTENAREALIRELEEELGIVISPDEEEPIAVAREEGAAQTQKIVIELYTCRSWIGEPAALEGGEVGWFLPAQVQALDKPPLDIVLAQQLFAKEVG